MFPFGVVPYFLFPRKRIKKRFVLSQTKRRLPDDIYVNYKPLSWPVEHQYYLLVGLVVLFDLGFIGRYLKLANQSFIVNPLTFQVSSTKIAQFIYRLLQFMLFCRITVKFFCWPPLRFSFRPKIFNKVSLKVKPSNYFQQSLQERWDYFKKQKQLKKQQKNLKVRNPFKVSSYFLILRTTITNLYLTFTNAQGEVLFASTTGALGCKKRKERHAPFNLILLLDKCFKLVRKRRLTKHITYMFTFPSRPYMRTVMSRAYRHRLIVKRFVYAPIRIHGNPLTKRRIKRL